MHAFDKIDHEEGGFVDFLDEARADQAAQQRSRERWLRQQVTEEARFAGTLVNLAERRAPVAVRVANGRTHRGEIAVVGLDFCLVRGAVDAYLALDGLVWVRPTGASGAVAMGDRPAQADLSLIELLGRLAPDRPRVALFLRGDPDPLTGHLRAVGLDVLTLQVAGDGRDTCFVPTSALWEVVLTRD